MDDTAKYVIHADITADGVVERSDVVGAVFGQTEGLLGDDLDLRDLQQSSKLGRIDVDIDSENGQSFGTITIASSLDKVETSILAAALETISRVGPCRATVATAGIEDVRAAKRRKVVERAKELLTDSFDEDVMTSREILEEVRQSVRVEDIAEYEGLPAGPRVEDSDAIIVVEGRADVLNLLRYGVKNAVAVEGTNVPDAVADLTQNRTVTAFLDGDRGGDLIRKELAQVGDIDYVAFAPANQSVEDLARHEVMSALRSKRPFDESMVGEEADEADGSAEEATADATSADASEAGPAATDGSARPAPESDETGPEGPATPDDTDRPTAAESASADADPASDAADAGESDLFDGIEAEVQAETIDDAESLAGADAETAGAPADAEAVADAGTATEGTAEAASAPDAAAETPREPATVQGHVEAVVDGETGTARLLDESFGVLAEVAGENAFDAVESADEAPFAVVLDGTVDQRLLDVSAQRGVGQVVGRDCGEFVKRPANVRVRTADQF
ncbi:DNA primase DnaG [Halorussus gelatinilyticus]|uniref:DNA primase DnaG n=1 Tax=Halorussus gelatinilyticus TaxID=2937524 RepID=A0A8U0IIH4_9EURY|nr:DNA primase DnaG [Halorussus gelatinilyticus]UPW00900.1 DNA primase DnaG [Halorussus gelatinilyticus]